MTSDQLLASQGIVAPPELPEHGFRIDVYQPRAITPLQFYEAIVAICGLRGTAPSPLECERLMVDSDGQTVHLEFLLDDGRLAVVDVPLDRGIKGLL